MQVRRSIGCDQPFYPKRANQCYHDAKCAKARWRDKDRPRVRRADPHPPAVQEFFRVVERAMPVNAVGYRLYCRELNVVIPIPGSRRRDGSRPASANFTLRPSEIPILPLAPILPSDLLVYFFGCDRGLALWRRWRSSLPRDELLHCFTPAHLARSASVEVAKPSLPSATWAIPRHASWRSVPNPRLNVLSTVSVGRMAADAKVACAPVRGAVLAYVFARCRAA